LEVHDGSYKRSERFSGVSSKAARDGVDRFEGGVCFDVDFRVDSERASSASHSPEQVGVLACVGADFRTVGFDNIKLNNV
jgi:hypothetical protein